MKTQFIEVLRRAYCILKRDQYAKTLQKLEYVLGTITAPDHVIEVALQRTLIDASRRLIEKLEIMQAADNENEIHPHSSSINTSSGEDQDINNSRNNMITPNDLIRYANTSTIRIFLEIDNPPLFVGKGKYHLKSLNQITGLRVVISSPTKSSGNKSKGALLTVTATSSQQLSTFFTSGPIRRLISRQHVLRIKKSINQRFKSMPLDTKADLDSVLSYCSSEDKISKNGPNNNANDIKMEQFVIDE